MRADRSDRTPERLRMTLKFDLSANRNQLFTIAVLVFEKTPKFLYFIGAINTTLHPTTDSRLEHQVTTAATFCESHRRVKRVNNIRSGCIS